GRAVVAAREAAADAARRGAHAARRLGEQRAGAAARGGFVAVARGAGASAWCVVLRHQRHECAHGARGGGRFGNGAEGGGGDGLVPGADGGGAAGGGWGGGGRGGTCRWWCRDVGKRRCEGKPAAGRRGWVVTPRRG